jgi:phage repressor protein C with HTH and peptisase S24 domain
MDRGQIIAWMQRHDINNRKLAELLEISEDKVSKSLTDKGKPRQWKAAEALRLSQLIKDDQSPLIKTEVRGTGMTAAEVRDAWAMRGNVEPVPLVGTALGGAFGDLEGVEMTELRLHEILDYLARPQGLADDRDAYAVEIVGDSMAPRFEPGERVFVSPKATVRPGDDVIIQLTDPNGRGDHADAITEVLIKRLVRRTASYVELRQFNPDTTFEVPITRIATQGGKLAMHRVRGRL